MLCYQARIISGSLILKEHENAKWLEKAELNSVNWLPADLEILNLVSELL